MLSFFWIVWFADGTAISQFHPETGEEIPFRDVEKLGKQIVKAGWYPFPPRLIRMLASRGTMVMPLPAHKKVEVELGPDCELILKRVGMLSISIEGRPRRETYYVIGRKRNDNLDVAVLDPKGRRLGRDGFI